MHWSTDKEKEGRREADQMRARQVRRCHGAFTTGRSLTALRRARK